MTFGDAFAPQQKKKKLSDISIATTLARKKVELPFRAVVVKTKSGWNGSSQAREGRSRFARGKADPNLFVNPRSKNRPSTKEVTAVVVYVRESLVALECES